MKSGYLETTRDYPYDFTVALYSKDYIPITDDQGNKQEDRSITFHDSKEKYTP